LGSRRVHAHLARERRKGGREGGREGWRKGRRKMNEAHAGFVGLSNGFIFQTGR
jgi:hypothetical protein